MKIERRRFVKMLTFGTATSVISGKLWQREVLAFCVPSPGQENAVLRNRVSDFPALQQDFRNDTRRPSRSNQPDRFGAPTTIFLNRTTSKGFYAIGMVLTEVWIK